MTFEEWFRQIWPLPDTDQDWINLVRQAWEAGFQEGKDEQIRLERSSEYDRSVHGD